MKIALIGYGKMGKMIEQIALERGHEIVSIIDIDNQQDFDSPEFASADVAIEFTAPQAAYGNYLKAWAKGVKVVSGSTGWMKEHGDDVRKACAEDGKTLFWASNFSHRRGHLLGRQPLPGQDYEPVPAVRRGDGGDPPRA